ncbi:MAG: hypothetical protein U5O39_10720 [Gammaproteobacteria bacterium]|nr:hypothetical protein [Gammaproteobacteria bacterium]
MLDSGDKLPTLQLSLVDGDEITLPDDLDTDFAIILFYRGHR